VVVAAFSLRLFVTGERESHPDVATFQSVAMVMMKRAFLLCGEWWLMPRDGAVSQSATLAR
jgi:hypothetical protein